jgi:hypothetical protein
LIEELYLENKAIAIPLFLNIKSLHLSKNTVEKLQEDVLSSFKDKLTQNKSYLSLNNVDS